MRPSAQGRWRARSVVPLIVLAACAVAALLAPGLAAAAWTAPVAIRSEPLNSGSFLVSCDAVPCPPTDGVLGRLRMTGPRSAVGAITIPEVWPYDSGTSQWGDEDEEPKATNRIRYVVRPRLYGVSLANGAWTLTNLGVFANQEPPWTELDFALGADAAGNAVVVYTDRQTSALGHEAYVVARRWAGGAWQAPERLDGPSVGDDGGQPIQLAVAPNGEASVYFEDWVCANGASYCQATANWMRPLQAGAFGPGLLVNADSRSPTAMATATAGDGVSSMFWARWQGGVAAASSNLELMARTAGPTGLGTPVIGPAAPSIGGLHAVSGPKGSALLTLGFGQSGSAAFGAIGFDGSAFGAFTPLSTERRSWEFSDLSGTPGEATLVYDEGGWSKGTTPMTEGFDILDPMKRRLLMRRWSGGAWSAPVDVAGGLPAPAQPSVVGPDDVAAGNGAVIFAAGEPSPDGLRGTDRVYAVDASGAAPTKPVAIDNGPGGWVHAVAVDRWGGDGSTAAIFTQLGPDGNVRLYGVENVPDAPPATRPTFGRELCVDGYSQLAGCTSTSLDGVRATAAPVVAQDGALVVRGTAVQVVRPAKAARGAAGSGPARAAKTRPLASGSVVVAVQRTVKDRSCRWWNARTRRFVKQSCLEPLSWSTRVKRGRFSLRLPRVPAGKVTVWTRARNGNLSQNVLKLGTSRKVVTVRRR